MLCDIWFQERFGQGVAHAALTIVATSFETAIAKLFTTNEDASTEACEGMCYIRSVIRGQTTAQQHVHTH